MEYSNAIRIEFESASAAMSCEESVMTCLDNIDAKSFGYSEKCNFGALLREGMSYDGEKTFFIDEEDYFGIATPEDMLELVPQMAKVIADNNPELPFAISNINTGTYSDSEVELRYRDRKIEIKTIYYPEGDYENMLCCPECGEEIVSMTEFEEGKAYICPECGEKCELDDEYEEMRPIEKKETIEL